MAQLTMITESVAEAVNRFAEQATGVEVTRGGVRTIIGEVEALLEQIGVTEPRLITELEALGLDTAATLAATLGADWTGEAADRFRGSTEELIAFIDQVRERLRVAYADFNAARENLRTILLEVGAEFDARAAEGEETTIDYRGVLEARISETESLFSKILI